MIADIKTVMCRIEYAEGNYAAFRLPAKDICRIHMQLELLKSGRLKELILQDEKGVSVAVCASMLGFDLLENIVEMLEQGFMACGDISWMHVDGEILVDGSMIEVAVGFFY